MDIVLGDWLVRPSLNRIELRGRSVHLEPKQMDLLVFLAERAGDVVSKDELFERVWQEQFVTDSVLTRSVAELRRALGDDVRAPRFIETIPKRGYRLVATVQPAPAERQARRPLSRLGAAWLGLAGVLLVAMVLWWLRHPSRELDPADAAEPGIYQLTTQPHNEVFPSFSPEGNAIAYSSDRNGSFEIYVRQLSPEGRDLQLTNDGQDNLQPAWSPDNALIAYHSRRREGVWVIPALGGQPRQISEFGSRPTWSPDGRAVLFQADSHRRLEPGGDIALPPATLWMVDPEGRQLRQLTQPGTPPGGHGNAAVSPDGEWVAFTGSFLQSSRLWQLSLASGKLHPILPVGWYRSPVFAADGKSLYYAGHAEGDTWLFQFELGNGPTSPRRLARLPGGHLALSPDGRQLAFSRFSSESNLWTLPIDLDSGDPTGEPVPLTRSTGRRNTFPVVSPDGSRIAYMARRIGLPFQIWLVNRAGEDAVQLTSIGDTPAWSRDGRYVYFHDRSAGSTWHRVDVQSRRITRVGQGGQGRQARSFFPDEGLVAFHRATDGIANVWVADIASGRETQITFDRVFAGFPVWSPDGSEIAFEIRRGSSFQLAVIPASGGEPNLLTPGSGQSWPSGWSPDGQRIVFVGQRDGVWNLYWISRDGEKLRRLTDYDDQLGLIIGGASWSSTGDLIAYELRTISSDLWVVTLD